MPPGLSRFPRTLSRRTQMGFSGCKRTVQLPAMLRPVLALVLILGCKSTSSKPVDTAPNPAEKGVATRNAAGADIDLNCVIRHIQSPPESFHYSFNDSSDNSWQEDADVTPQNI